MTHYLYSFFICMDDIVPLLNYVSMHSSVSGFLPLLLGFIETASVALESDVLSEFDAFFVSAEFV